MHQFATGPPRAARRSTAPWPRQRLGCRWTGRPPTTLCRSEPCPVGRRHRRGGSPPRIDEGARPRVGRLAGHGRPPLAAASRRRHGTVERGRPARALQRIRAGGQRDRRTCRPCGRGRAALRRARAASAGRGHVWRRRRSCTRCRSRSDGGASFAARSTACPDRARPGRRARVQDRAAPRTGTRRSCVSTLGPSSSCSPEATFTPS